MKMNVVFLQNSATQPRCHKRFRSFRQAEINGVVYSFDRNWYNVNLPDDIQINTLGNLNPGSYLKRLLLYFRKLRPIFKKHKGNLFYCYGQDMAFVAYCFRQPFIYEESDLMYLEYKNAFVRRILTKVDLFIQRKSKATVLTSQGFVDYLYHKNKPDNVFVIPNKLDSSFLSVHRPTTKVKDISKLRFAFIGLIRYNQLITTFIEEMVKFNPAFEFHIWGDGSENQREVAKQLCVQYPTQVFFHGPFRNPIDLPNIYNQVDVNFVCYDTKGLNERIAEPNKLYESIFFNTPILVSPNTYLTKVVKQLETGFIVNCYDRSSIAEFFQTVNVDMLNARIEHCKAISNDFIIDDVSSVRHILDFLTNK